MDPARHIDDTTIVTAGTRPYDLAIPIPIVGRWSRQRPYTPPVRAEPAANAGFPHRATKNEFHALEPTVRFTIPRVRIIRVMDQQVLVSITVSANSTGMAMSLTSGAKGQLLNALRIRAQSLISSFWIRLSMSTRSSKGRFGSVSDLRRD